MPDAASDGGEDVAAGEPTDPASRLDAELVRRGLARSRALAVEAIAGGRVTVDGKQALKAVAAGARRMPSSAWSATTAT